MYFDGLQRALSNKRVLELGAGNGLNALLLGRLGAEVVTIDISSASEALITKAADELGLNNVRALSGDFIEMDLPFRSFDYVLGLNFLHQLPIDQEKAYFG